MKPLLFQGQEYRAIPQLSGYWISKSGQVISTRAWKGGNKSPQLKTLFPDKDGYLRFSQKVAGNRRYKPVHIALLEAWRGARPPGWVACHRNDQRQDNRLENLRWDTHTENYKDSRRNQTHTGRRNSQARMTESMVKKLRQDYRAQSLNQLKKQHPQYSKFALWAAVSGYTWSHLPGAIPKKRNCYKP